MFATVAWVDDELPARRLAEDPRAIEDLPARGGRTAAPRKRFGDVLDRLPADVAAGRFAVLRHLVSSTTWVTLRGRFGLDGRAAQSMTRALDVLLGNPGRRNDDGFTPAGEPPGDGQRADAGSLLVELRRADPDEPCATLAFTC